MKYVFIVAGVAFIFLGFLYLMEGVNAQTPPPTDPKVTVPVSLLQALVNAGQDSPGKVINPLTDQVRTLVNEQLGPKQTAQASTTAAPATETTTAPVIAKPPPATLGNPDLVPGQPQTPQGAPPHHPLPTPELEKK